MQMAARYSYFVFVRYILQHFGSRDMIWIKKYDIYIFINTCFIRRTKADVHITGSKMVWELFQTRKININNMFYDVTVWRAQPIMGLDQ